MPTLKEIKGRIGSVQSTLKITSAMKLVSSAKLRKAQTAIENMRPYQQKLQEILTLAGGTSSSSAPQPSFAGTPSSFAGPQPSFAGLTGEPNASDVVIVAIASNSSLCGGFNANAIAKAKEVLKEHPKATVYSIGRKMADAMRKAGYPSPQDWSSLSEHPSYSIVSAMVDKFIEDDVEVILVYNHFVSTGKQVPVAEVLIETPGTEAEGDENALPLSSVTTQSSSTVTLQSSSSDLFRGSQPDVIVEPSRKALLDALYPKTLKIKLFAALLDSAAAEHAARTVAMQTATDNGEDLLSELTLQYNKGRQQKITNEILDLAGGQARD